MIYRYFTNTKSVFIIHPFIIHPFQYFIKGVLLFPIRALFSHPFPVLFTVWICELLIREWFSKSNDYWLIEESSNCDGPLDKRKEFTVLLFLDVPIEEKLLYCYYSSSLSSNCSSIKFNTPSASNLSSGSS